MRIASFILSILIVIFLVAALALGLKFKQQHLDVKMPSYPAVEKAVWLDQNWKPDERTRYHHLSQGTITFGVPYEWFVALEQPELSPLEVGLLSDPAYLDGLGFIPSSAAQEIANNLPVGFARGAPMVDPSTGEKWLNPQTGENTTGIGFTCAACHTGRMTYKGTALYIDGAGALTDVAGLRTALGLSLIYTKYLPFRFERFAARLLGEDASETAKELTRAKLDMVVSDLIRVQSLESSFGALNRVEGFGRLDALNRIGNQVFGLDLNIQSNNAAISAPVNYPHIWWSSWFDWVQYNSSIEQPMVRNAGEALGVRALVNLVNVKPPLYNSTVEFEALHEIETLLAGQEQPRLGARYTGLRGPKWPEDILPPINQDLASKGSQLYEELCQPCHRPPVGTPAFFDDQWWTQPNEAGQRYLVMDPVPLEKIGTDPAQAEDMAKRLVSVPSDLGVKSDSFGFALGEVVEKTVTFWYDSQTPPVPPEKRAEMDGFRKNGIRAPLGYKARTLDGIWATAPYLHNGSVPSLYALLSPVSERPVNFTLGNREFDPEKVGLRHERLEGGTVLDTSLRGNWNKGHEFDDAPGRPGVIGRKLADEERRALVEYLKTI